MTTLRLRFFSVDITYDSGKRGGERDYTKGRGITSTNPLSEENKIEHHTSHSTLAKITDVKKHEDHALAISRRKISEEDPPQT